MNIQSGSSIEWIPVDRIIVVNPRTRDRRTFKEIVDNIERIGLKRPITATCRIEADGPIYDLVCGQGRLEAYLALGQRVVPALIVIADTEDCLVASLVENCARRKHDAMDLMQDIGRMRAANQSVDDIAAKIGVSNEYVYGVAKLLKNGEIRLLRAVDAGSIPLTVAIDIAEASDHGIQNALQDAYDKKLLRGKNLLKAKRLVEARRRRGRAIGRELPVSSTDLVREFEADVARKNDIIRRGNATRDKILLIIEAIRRLLADSQFVHLVEREHLTTLPTSISRRLHTERIIGQ